MASVSRIVLVCVLFLLCSCQSSKQVEENRVQPHVLLIVVDTLGARHLSDSISPEIMRLAAEGVNFTRAYATSSWTKPTIASIFTSHMPSRHTVIGVKSKLPEEELTLAEILGKVEYQTMGVVSHTLIGRKSGLAQGFAEYAQVNSTKKTHTAITSHLVTERAIKWLDEFTAQEGEKKFFMFLHYFDPHYRYMHHEEFDRTSSYRGALKSGMSLEALMKRRGSLSALDTAYLRGLYDEEISYTDSQIGRVLQYLQEHSLLDNTLVILTADHGEEFMEHKSLGHTATLYEEIISIPLMFLLPGRSDPLARQELVSQLDILPTVAALLGLEAQSSWQGKSLLPYFSESSELHDPERTLLSEVSYISVEGIKSPDKISARKGDWKLIHDRSQGKNELYNLQRDANERKNLIAEQPPMLRELSDAIVKFDEEIQSGSAVKPAPAEGEVDAEEIKKLKSLGYL